MDKLLTFEQEFERLEKEVGDYKPAAFNYLRTRFFELYKDKRFDAQYFFDKELKEGENPVEEWLTANGYPIDEGEKHFLQFVTSLAEKSKKEFLVLMKRYMLAAENNPAFIHKVEEFGKHGGNYFRVWCEKNHFRAVFKEVNQNG